MASLGSAKLGSQEKRQPIPEFVSVITPTRLLPDRLGMLVELNQSLTENRCNVEHVIVVDGNSADNIPKELAGRATVLATKRQIGQSAARNLGLVVASGDWITSADDDDWLYPQSLDKDWEQSTLSPIPSGRPAIAPTTSNRIPRSCPQDPVCLGTFGVPGRSRRPVSPWDPQLCWSKPIS